MVGDLCNDLGLPGELRFRIGSAADYRQLARFHYTQAAPASFTLTACIDQVAHPWERRVVAVGVLSNPALNCRVREEALRLGAVPREWRWVYLNHHLRTISRVIVHPQFRGIGLSSAMVRFLLSQSPTRYIEAISRLGAHHPLFERAGMRRLDPARNETAYYLLDRLGNTQRPREAFASWPNAQCPMNAQVAMLEDHLSAFGHLAIGHSLGIGNWSLVIRATGVRFCPLCYSRVLHRKVFDPVFVLS